LSGCGAGASPGLGATVGEETISASRIDEVTRHLCTARSGQLDAEGKVSPLLDLRLEVVVRLVLGSQAEQIADEYALSPSAVYERAVVENTRAASVMPEEVRTDYIEVMSTVALFSDVAEQVGRAKLTAEGFAEPTIEQVGQAGSDVFATWPDANGIEVNPKYGVELVDGRLVPVDTSLSFAFSDEAKSGTAIELDPTYASSLPSSQRCGG